MDRPRIALLGFALMLPACGDGAAASAPDASADVIAPDRADAADAPDRAPSDGTASDVVDGSAVDAVTARASFGDVQALFAQGCITAACHGAARSGGLSLVDGDTTFAAMVDQPSQEVPGMRLVRPGNPDQSYLMVKIDGTMRTLPECAISMGSNPCGAQMPQLEAPLSAVQVELIRSWIAQGALRQ